MTAGVGTSMLYSGITSTLAERRRNGFPRHGRKVGDRSQIPLQPASPAGYGAAEAIWFAPLSKERLRVNASNEGNARRLIKICSAPAAEDRLARHCLNAPSA